MVWLDSRDLKENGVTAVLQAKMVCQATTEKMACQVAVDHQEKTAKTASRAIAVLQEKMAKMVCQATTEKMVCQVAADHQEKMAKTACQVVAVLQD
jgi:hypothetical protein